MLRTVLVTVFQYFGCGKLFSFLLLQPLSLVRTDWSQWKLNPMCVCVCVCVQFCPSPTCFSTLLFPCVCVFSSTIYPGSLITLSFPFFLTAAFEVKSLEGSYLWTIYTNTDGYALVFSLSFLSSNVNQRKNLSLMQLIHPQYSIVKSLFYWHNLRLLLDVNRQKIRWAIIIPSWNGNHGQRHTLIVMNP